MLFVETPYFTKFCREHSNDDELRELQTLLVAHPETGDLTADQRKLLVQWVQEVLSDG